MSLSRALSYATAHRSKFLKELKDFIRFPTVSAQPQHAVDMKRCAAWLAANLRQSGLEDAKVVPNGSYPLVYASWRRIPQRPTVLIYGHYDVQPAEPLSEWQSGPFDPVVRGLDLYGRGSSDDKGQMFTQVKALESYLRTSGRLPVNVKCLFEGGEEIGSPNLSRLVVRNEGLLAADVAVISDTTILGAQRPAINYALRGALGLELEVRGPKHDLHSGDFGGAIHNPLQALAEIVASLHDDRGRVAIPGFYRSVRRASQHERAYLAQAGPSDLDVLRSAEAQNGWGETDYSLYERTTLRPALTVNGLVGGYQGLGGKGVIPTRALAKLSFRLVPDQDPSEIDRLFREHIDRITPPTVRSRVRTLAAAKPALSDVRHPAIRAAALAYRKGFGSSPVFLRSGGTIPVVDTFQEVLGVPTVVMGFGLPDGRIHAPNEKFHLPTFYNGITTCIWFLAALTVAQKHPSRRKEMRAISLEEVR
jgi:acetylornithine deacetylase/succinyl-diaminopimelate desuccinylase-like protein